MRIFAALVLLVWAGNALPPLVALAAADDSCQMDCCKGMARHSAGSCAGGACHLKPKKKPVAAEIICGAREFAQKRIAADKNKLFRQVKQKPNVPIFDETLNSDSSHNKGFPFLQTMIVEQSCQIVCSASAGSGLGQPNGRANDKTAALLAFAARPRPPTVVTIEFSCSFVVKNSFHIARNSPARAPPTVIS